MYGVNVPLPTVCTIARLSQTTPLPAGISIEGLERVAVVPHVVAEEPRLQVRPAVGALAVQEVPEIRKIRDALATSG
jgi:hypothetical protein